MPALRLFEDPLHGVDAATMRFLDLHEAHAHALGGREVRDLGDGVLLHDPKDPEPFWNRLAAIRWPDGRDAFDRRLDQAMAMFASIARQPHLWLAPAHNRPADVARRLEDRGFIDLGGGHIMVLVDGRPAAAAAAQRPPRGIELERVLGGARPPSTFIEDVSLVLADAFDVPPERRGPIQLELARSMGSAALATYLVRVDGEPVAVAKRSTFDGASYLASIGVRPPWQGRGLGRLVTAAAVADAVAAGSRWTYLGVFADNVGAQRLYERLGFAILGDRASDYLLR